MKFFTQYRWRFLTGAVLALASIASVFAYQVFFMGFDYAKKFPGYAEYPADISQPLTERDIADIFGQPEPFNPDRTQEQIRAKCAHWQEPQPPDEASQRWYRAATTIAADVQNTSDEYRKMLILYEGAARKGHYKAIKDLAIVYNKGDVFYYKTPGHIPAEESKSLSWITYGVKHKKWSGALEWVANGMLNGDNGFEYNEKLGLIYLQQAADLGVALAQYQLALYYDKIPPKQFLKRSVDMLECAAEQNFGPALKDLAWRIQIQARVRDGYGEKALDLYQRAVMAGGEKGGKAASTLQGAFLDVDSDAKIDMQIPTDPIRSKAYGELCDALTYGYTENGKTIGPNPFLRFPRLNEVLPLPPAEVKEWKGIYSAMSPEDAEYYRNPTDPDILIEEIRQAGLLVSDEYLSKFVPKKEEKE